MNRNEILAYVAAAALGGAVAGHMVGLVGMLAVFAGIGIVGFTEMLLVLSRIDE